MLHNMAAIRLRPFSAHTLILRLHRLCSVPVSSANIVSLCTLVFASPALDYTLAEPLAYSKPPWLCTGCISDDTL